MMIAITALLLLGNGGEESQKRIMSIAETCPTEGSHPFPGK
jgi:hypothetical protein